MATKQASPAAVRNAPHLIEVLKRILPAQGQVLEIASGSGYHAAAFAAAFPHLTWQPTDASAEARASIAAYAEEGGLNNLCAAQDLDVMRQPWIITEADALVCINMIHISPWAATVALFEGAARVLAPGAPMLTYGPYILHGDFGAQSNIDFDQSLKSRNPEWGLRDVDDVTRTAIILGFTLDEIVPMPANNLSLVFRRV